MISKPNILTMAGLALALTPAYAASIMTSADFNPTTPARPSAGYLNDYLRQDDPGMATWDLGVNTRLRYEVRDNFGIAGKAGSVDFRDHGADVDNAYFLYRLRPRIGYNSEWFSALVEGQHSGETGDERNPNPEADSFDFHQAYVLIGNHKEFPLSLKAGRQELIYGDERLVGAVGWNNIGRAFDAAKLRWQTPWFGADFFTSRPVVPDDHNFDMSNDYEYFSGAYFSSKWIPKQTTDLYFLARNASPKATSYPLRTQVVGSARDIYTVGARVKSNVGELNGWDYGAEVAGQFGNFKDGAKRLEQEAYMLYLGAGYTFTKTKYTPRLGMEYNFSSGDSNKADNKHETFDNLYPTNHKFYGFMDFVSLQNINDLRFMSSIKPLPRLTLNADYHGFWLADTHDSFYNVTGGRRGTTAATPTGENYGINPGYDNFVGTELDLVASYAVSPQAMLEVGYGHFFVGDYIKQSLHAATRGSTDANWFYVSLTISF